MARSAKSKGYRKYSKKKHTWTEKEKKQILWGSIVVAAVLLIAIAWNPIVDLVTQMKVENGVIQGGEDNWVVYNAKTQSSPQVFRLAKVGDMPEGFEFAEAERSLMRGVMVKYTADESAFPNSVIFQGGGKNYLKTAQDVCNDTLVSGLALGGGELIDKSEVREEKIGGKRTAWFTYTYFREETENGEKTGETKYFQYLLGYVKARRNNTCVVIQVGGERPSEADFVSEDALKKVLDEVVANLKIG